MLQMSHPSPSITLESFGMRPLDYEAEWIVHASYLLFPKITWLSKMKMVF
jgi:hypothetical protein